MRNLIDSLALCAAAAGFMIAFGASLRLAFDAREAREVERDIPRIRDRLYEILDREEQ